MKFKVGDKVLIFDKKPIVGEIKTIYPDDLVSVYERIYPNDPSYRIKIYMTEELLPFNKHNYNILHSPNRCIQNVSSWRQSDTK